MNELKTADPSGNPFRTLWQKAVRACPSGTGRVAGNVITWLLLAIMALLLFFLSQAFIPGRAPGVFGRQFYIVMSGSMSPAFDTGSLIFVHPADPETIRPGDIITFRSSRSAARITTHRVVDIEQDGGLRFVTRGDANNVSDPQPVPAENVIGIVGGSVPLIGYLLAFARTGPGLICLIFIPGALLIAGEVRSICRNWRLGKRNKSPGMLNE